MMKEYFKKNMSVGDKSNKNLQIGDNRAAILSGGERTVKTSGENAAMFVNAEFAGGSLEGAMLKAASLKDNFRQGDSYEQYQYFYHPDHLGSSSFITNTEGEVVQHIEYVPYGEVFIEERNNVWNTPYLFNAKEFDEETGFYYYGARYYDSRLAIFLTTDRYAEKYPWQSVYSYAGGNPVRFIDVNGDSIRFADNRAKDIVDGAISAEFGRLYDKYNGNIPDRQLRKWGRYRNSDGDSYRQLFRESGGHNSMRRLTYAK